MHPFLAKKVLDAKSFRDAFDKDHNLIMESRKIRGYEKNVLMCIAMNTAYEGAFDLSMSMSKTAMKLKKIDEHSDEELRTTSERKLVKLLSSSRKITQTFIAEKSSMSRRRVWDIFNEFWKIGVLREDNSINEDMLIS